MRDASADVRVVDLDGARADHVEQAARVLHTAFLGRTRDWQTMDGAREEVQESLADGRISRVALDGSDHVVGWVGAIPMDWYPGGVWELHPLVVDAGWRGRGLGRRLVEDLETVLRARGCRTIYLGTDDENFETSLGGADLYEDLPSKLARVANPGGHPIGFYERVGYTIVGVLPDANGPGKPDVFMAKRL